MLTCLSPFLTLNMIALLIYGPVMIYSSYYYSYYNGSHVKKHVISQQII